MDNVETKKKSNLRRNIIDIVFLLVVFGLTIYGVFHGENLEEVLEDLKKCDLAILVAPCIICVLAFILLESVIMKYIFRTLGTKLRLTRAYLYSFVGFFFSCITPSASGGQPAQIVFMRKDKLNVAHSTLVLLLITIGYKLVLVILGGVTLIIRPKRIMDAVEPVEFWVWLGIVLNIIVIVALFVLVFMPSVAKWIIKKSIGFLNKVRILKDKDKWLHKTDDMMVKYEDASKYLKDHKIVIFNVILLSILQRLILFFITVIVYWSFHLRGTSIIDILMLQCLISVGADMLPLPGGMGITERLFLAMFAPAFGDLTLPAMILSRGFSYYIQLLISAVMTVVAYILIFKKGRKKE